MSSDIREAMRLAGLEYSGPILADGRLHRFKSEGDHERNSWYVLRAGPPAAGAFGCWRRGLSETWHARNGQASERDLESIRKSWRAADTELKRTERERRETARKVAARLFDTATAPDGNGYLAAKGVQAYGDLRQRGGQLVVPLRDSDGTLHTLQLIAPDGTKRFLPGGRVEGCSFILADKPDGTLVIAEGYATAASALQATGFATVAAMHCRNLLAVATAVRAKWPQREIVIAADNDQWTEGNPGVTKAREAALAIGARLAVPQFAEISNRPTDFNDLAVVAGLPEVKRQVETSTVPKETDEELFQRMAKLTSVEYDRVRDKEAERAAIRVGTLDKEVAKRRPREETPDVVQGFKVTFPDLEPWPEPVNGAALLNEIAATLERFVVAPVVAIVAASLIVLHTYAFDLGDISPILFITGPTKRCGKSKLLAILLRLVSKPFAASSATAAGIYRTIELHHPTLCIDEVDAFIHGDEQLRGLINSGHTRDAAFHLGCAVIGDKEFEPRRWSTWTPKIFAGIGRLADTIEDRAIIIRMVRRRKEEPCERLRYGARFDDIRRKALRFVNDHAEIIKDANPSLPDALNDRAGDNWTPLLILADLAGGDWPHKARQAALALCGGDDGKDASGIGENLLADIKAVFGSSGLDRLPSAKLAEELHKFEGKPWAEFKSGKGISPNQIARLLKPFGVAPDSIRTAEAKGTVKGYHLVQFEDAFARYLPDPPLPDRNNATKPGTIEDSALSKQEHPEPCSGSKNPISTNDTNGYSVVPHRKPPRSTMLL
jgi:putative DNA primase/helicase